MGKKVLVTGAAKGIGQAVALSMAKYGAKIIAADIVTCGETIRKIEMAGGDASAVVLDVTDTRGFDESMQEITEIFVGLDVLINNAGIYNNGVVLEYSEKLWDQLMNVNLKGAFFLAQAVAKYMSENGGGKIINIASQAGKFPEFSNVGYCISKAGVIMMTQIMALELAKYNIFVNAVCPGYTETDLLRNSYKDKSNAYNMTIEETKQEMFAAVPLKRPAQPEEIGELVSFLASDRANYIDGESVLINGGTFME
jgi:NAD(P)-dependent dehydrogenase (short-subunit alcohol dehydrogenase family)